MLRVKTFSKHKEMMPGGKKNQEKHEDNLLAMELIRFLKVNQETYLQAWRLTKELRMMS